MLRFASRFAVTIALLAPAAHAASGTALRVYLIDVEGGQATLFVTPDNQSLLIDTGWPGHGSRDADRIAAAAKDAGIGKIDYVLITHYHDDHVGGAPQLAARIPIGAFIDHGPNRELDNPPTVQNEALYRQLWAAGRYQHIVAKPGDMLPLTGIAATVVSADGEVIDHALPGGGGANPACAASPLKTADRTENARSLGIELTFGKLKLLDLGDLTWDKERDLMCPTDRLGPQTVYIVSHHGWYQSSSPALVDALHARVAMMDNGERKGGSVPTFDTLAKAPGLEALYQLHASAEAGTKNAPDASIANPLGTDAGYFLKLSGHRDGSFEVLNARTGQTTRYRSR